MADRPVLQPIIKRSHSPSQQAISNEALRSPTFIEEPPTSPNLANAASAVAIGGGKHSPQTAKALAQGSYFALQPPATTTPSPSTGGILLNRLDREAVASPPATAEAPIGGGSAAALLRVASPDGSASESGASEVGLPAPSTAPTSAAGSPVPAHSVSGSNTAQKPNLSTLFMGEPSTDAAPGKTPHSATTPVDPSQPGSVRRVSSPPSPHCHFAPLPRVDTERPLSRRESSTANRVKPFVPKVLPKGPERTDSILATGFSTTTTGAAPQASSSDASRDEGGLPSPPRLWHAGDPSIPSAAALSQRLSSSLTFVDAPSLSPNPSSTGATGTASPGSRPTSRRSSSSRRSRSPSPHYYNQNRDRYRNVSATSASTAAATGAGSEVRTQSPNLSRHASTDALSLHYIEQQRDYSHHHHHHYHRDGTTRSESGGRIISRTSSRAGSERDATEASASADRSRRSSTSRVRGAPPPSSSAATASAVGVGGVPFVDRDKEADLHRLETKALAGNADAERCVSPALRAHEEQQRLLGLQQQQQQQQRDRSASRSGGPSAAVAAAAHATGSDGGESKSQVLKRTNSHEEVVQIKPPSGDGGEPERGDGELEEVLEEPEEAEAEAEAAAAGTRLAGDDDVDDDEDEEEEDDDDEEDDDEEDEDEEEDEEEDDNEEDRSREEENDDDEDEEEEEEPAEDRKTSLGAGVEVVRWHRAERDSASPTPAIAQHQTRTTLSAPSSPPPPPPVAGLPPVSAPTSSVSPGVAASS